MSTISIEEYLPLVPPIARRVYRKTGRRAELEDLIGEGNLALVRCAPRFDPTIGCPFAVYARRRIHGALLDYLREADELSRLDRKRRKALEEPQRVTFTYAEFDTEMGGFLELQPTRETDALTLAMRAELCAMALAAVAVAARSGNRKMALAMELYFFGDLLMSEIADHLGVGPARVSQLIKTGLRACRELMTDESSGPKRVISSSSSLPRP